MPKGKPWTPLSQDIDLLERLFWCGVFFKERAFPWRVGKGVWDPPKAKDAIPVGTNRTSKEQKDKGINQKYLGLDPDGILIYNHKDVNNGVSW